MELSYYSLRAILTPLLLLSLSLLWLARGVLALRLLVWSSRSPLRARGCPLLRRLLVILNLRMSCLRWLSARGGWGTLLAWRSTLDIRLPDTSFCRRCLSSLLGHPLLSWRALHCPSLELFPHYGVTRLVTIILLLKHMLLLDLLGILIP